MIVSINATKITRSIMKNTYAVSIPHYLQSIPVSINPDRSISKDELLPTYEIPGWVYKRVFKNNKHNKYNS